MKRVLFVLRNLLGGGIERIALNLAREMQSQGHEVHLLLQRDRIDYPIDFDLNLHVLDVEKENRRSPGGWLWSGVTKLGLRHLLPNSDYIWAGGYYRRHTDRLIEDLERQYGKFDLIFVRGIGAFKYLWRLRRPNLYFSVHITPQLMDKQRRGLSHIYNSWLHRKLYEDRDLICVSHGLQEMLLEQSARAGATVRSAHVIHNPCDLEAVRRMATEPLPGVDGQFILNVGRMVPQKRLDLLIRAFAKTQLDCKLVLLGKGSLQPGLERLASQLGIRERVLFPGFDANPYRWMKRARMFVLSSDYEGFGNVLVESLACETPVISTDCPCGPNEILVDDLARGLARVGDVDHLADKMIQFYADPGRIEERHVARFALPKVTQTYLTLPST